MPHPELPPRPSGFYRVKSWYAKYERPLSSISLVGGFVFDAITLTRVDRFWENFWVIAHLAIVGLCIILVNIQENEEGAEANPDKFHFWLVNILQFFFGGLLSTFLVFYFRSGSIAASWPFFIILAASFVANESLKRHYTRIVFQVSLFYLSLYAFAIYLVPVLVHAIGAWEFILSGVASLVALWLFLLIIRISAREKFRKSRIWLFLAIGVLFAGINVLYFYNLIPPIPLSLKDSGIYNSFMVNAPGNYTAQAEAPDFWNYFEPYPDVHIISGDPLYAYSAIYSPAEFSTQIVHVWQYNDPATGAWVTRGRIILATAGGGESGWRTFSEEENLLPGHWRVNVETASGQVIGTIRFNVVVGDVEPALQTVLIN